MDYDQGDVFEEIEKYPGKIYNENINASSIPNT